eukprot:8153567-Alexandrium_andersonii.AAC.1
MAHLGHLDLQRGVAGCHACAFCVVWAAVAQHSFALSRLCACRVGGCAQHQYVVGPWGAMLTVWAGELVLRCVRVSGG